MSVQEFMQKSGIPNKLRGYEFIKKAIELKLENPNMNMSQIKMRIGVENGVTVVSIEKCIGWAIDNGFPNMNHMLRNVMFDYCKDAIPTPKEYIEGVAYAIRNNII